MRNGYEEVIHRLSLIPDREIKLIGVSKNRSVEEIEKLFQKGLRRFGENRVQEGKSKKELLSKEIEWHLIGHLQKNKVRDAVNVFDWIHSVDSLELAELLDKEAEKQGKKPRVLLQVNIADEPQKFGISLQEAEKVARTMNHLPHLQFSGMMVIAPLVEDAEKVRPIFLKGKELFETLRTEMSPDFSELSMGMSNDYSVALEEGATMIRVGRALFDEIEG